MSTSMAASIASAVATAMLGVVGLVASVVLTVLSRAASQGIVRGLRLLLLLLWHGRGWYCLVGRVALYLGAAIELLFEKGSIDDCILYRVAMRELL